MSRPRILIVVSVLLLKRLNLVTCHADAEFAGGVGQKTPTGLPDMFLNRSHNLQFIPV